MVKETNRTETNKSESSNGDNNSNKSGRWDGNTNKKAQSKNVSKKNETKKKIYTWRQYVNEYKELGFISKMTYRHNIYVRNFSGAKVKSMKDYTKPCTREENPNHIILHVGTNDLISDNSPKRVGKSIVD